MAGLPTLRGQRVTLRWLTSADVPAIYEVFSDPRVARFIGIPLMRDIDDSRAFLREVEELCYDRELFQWGLVENRLGIVAGTCTLASLDWTNRRAELGFALGRRFQGKGLMSEALPILIDHSFADLGLHRLEAFADPRNEASVRLLENLGFRREGDLRERDYVNGEWQNSICYGLLEREWKELRR